MNSKQFDVIVVEDEKLIANNIKKSIESCNPAFRVVAVAHSGLDALDMVKELLPDIVFTDIRMPELDGIELISRLTVEYPSIKKVIVSGYDDFVYAKSAILNHTENYLLKPINLDELRDTLRKIEEHYLHEKADASSRFYKDKQQPEDIARYLKDHIDEHYQEALNLASIAKELELSTSWLSRIFQKHTGESPSHYLKRRRMTVAVQLLRDKSYTIKQIAELVGIPDPFYFSRAFKQAYGSSPSRFRDEQL
ncbi:MAG: response regulator [Clostridiales Family XIII bacterium]|jgi:YesN/AraC family two-component response regulator|nr:response regulator [Clostridiales Family XIII bacterium]